MTILDGVVVAAAALAVMYMIGAAIEHRLARSGRAAPFPEERARPAAVFPKFPPGPPGLTPEQAFGGAGERIPVPADTDTERLTGIKPARFVAHDKQGRALLLAGPFVLTIEGRQICLTADQARALIWALNENLKKEKWHA